MTRDFMERNVMKQSKPIPQSLTKFSDLPDEAFIRLPTLKLLYGISAASCWRGVRNGKIPKPKKLFSRCTAWNVGLIRADLAAKAIA